MSNSKVVRAPVCFTDDDYSHCANCIDIVEYLLNPNTDVDSLYVTSDDIEFLARLVYRAFNIMGDVIESSEGPDYVI